MSDIKLVIKIPEDYYEALRKTDLMISGQRSGKTFMSVIYSAVAKGTPLPNGHGRLIDETQIHKCGWDYIKHHAKTDAPTIIEGSDSE